MAFPFYDEEKSGNQETKNNFVRFFMDSWLPDSSFLL